MKNSKRPARGSSPFLGPDLSRREMLRVGAGGLVASWLIGSSARAFSKKTAGVVPRGTAKNCILVFLGGAPSQTDTFDLKEGDWTPPKLAPTSYFDGKVRFPHGLFPQFSNQLGDVALVRSCLAWALVHGLAQTWTQISRNPAGVLGTIAPHIGSVVSLELESGRDPQRDVLPSFVALGSSDLPGSGYFPSRFAPFSVSPSPNGLPALTHPDGTERFAQRWDLLERLDGPLRSPGGPLGKLGSDVAGFSAQARTMMDSPEISSLFAVPDDESKRYGSSAAGDSCLVAKNLLAARRGARFVQVTFNGWDHHSGIYSSNGLYGQCNALDPALSNLLGDLRSTPGETAGKTLLDETLVIITGEFGRTVGTVNGSAGRDHFLRYAVMFAGGGVRGGRALGQTDALGAKLVDPGWSAGRDVRPEDLAATIYSALGIDWTTVRHDDPIGRGFEYVPGAKDGAYRPIDELFTG